VELVDADGAQVPGNVDDAADGAASVWGPDEPLAYDTK